MTSTERAPARALRVVVVDDSEEFRLLVQHGLSFDPRFDVVGSAADGAEALEIVAASQPDVVLLDLSLPDVSGLEVIPAVVERSPRSVVVVLSGFGDTRTRRQVREAGAAHFVDKGMTMDELADELARICGVVE